MEDTIIGEIKKNRGEKIVFSLGEFKGKKRIDIRTYFQGEEENSEVWKPTKKGINISLDQWQEFKELIKEVDNSLEP
ncbi:MAG: transcriptional coactivator p15/PC4 family protein [Candidatus Eremiobacterota bacterium]